MPLPTDVEVALALLQILGLLIPVAFVILQPLLTRQGDGEYSETKEVDAPKGRRRFMVVDRTPPLVYGALFVISVLGLAAIAVSVRIAEFVWGSWLITSGVLLLLLGLGALVGMVWLIREEFRSKVEGV